MTAGKFLLSFPYLQPVEGETCYYKDEIAHWSCRGTPEVSYRGLRIIWDLKGVLHPIFQQSLRKILVRFLYIQSGRPNPIPRLCLCQLLQDVSWHDSSYWMDLNCEASDVLTKREFELKRRNKVAF